VIFVTLLLTGTHSPHEQQDQRVVLTTTKSAVSQNGWVCVSREAPRLLTNVALRRALRATSCWLRPPSLFRRSLEENLFPVQVLPAIEVCSSRVQQLHFDVSNPPASSAHQRLSGVLRTQRCPWMASKAIGRGWPGSTLPSSGGKRKRRRSSPRFFVERCVSPLRSGRASRLPQVFW